MHLWNINALTDELRTNKLSERQAFSYFLLISAFQAASAFSTTDSHSFFAFDTLPFGSVVPYVWFVSEIVGLIVCFRINEQSDGRDFIRRFICLAVPSFTRTLVFCLPPIIIVTLIVGGVVPKGQGHTLAIIESWFVIEILMVVQYFIICRRLRAFASHETIPVRAGA